MQALAQPAEIRQAFLAKACGGDAALQAEIESLIAHHDIAEQSAFLSVAQPQAVLDETVRFSVESSRVEPIPQGPPHTSSRAGVDPQAMSWDVVLDSARKSGAVVSTGPAPQLAALSDLESRYEVLEEIGHGAMGFVYLGRHRKLGMDVAIKVLKQGASADRFLREARILAQLKSPYVVRIHDFEMLANGVSILVMEWVEGNDLHQMMRSFGGRVAEQYVLPWMRHVCEGMKVAAAEGIIHRDLKPSNILIYGKNHARVADFGLARNPAKPGDVSVAGNVLGTPYYMAPEQAEDPRGVDTRADIYSFGATFYHVLTGTPPFTGETLFSILYKHKTEPLVSPKARFPAISNRINAILERCLAKSPADRFQSFSTLLRQLETSAAESSPWNETDEEDLAGYLSQYRARRDAYFQFPRSIDLSDTFEFPDGRKLRILVGDLVEQKVDALASSDDGFLQMTGGVAAAIRKAAGEQVAFDASRFAPVRPGRAIVTSGGALTARFVFHGSTMGFSRDRLLLPSPDIISEILASCFYHADSLDVTTIAFPLFGTGAGGFPEDVCLDTLFRFLARAFLRGMTCVREARIVLFPGGPNRSHSILSHKTSDLPQDVPQIAGYSFYHNFVPAVKMGGGYYNYIPLTGGRLAVVIADGIRTGLGSIIRMRQVNARLKELLELQPDHPARVMKALNDWYTREYPADRFVTIAIAVLDANSHQVALVNAGQLPPIIRRSDGYSRKIEDLREYVSDMPLGISSESTFEQKTYSIGHGDVFVLYTAGVSEAMNERGEIFTSTRLLRVALEAGEGAPTVGWAIADDVSRFIGSRLQNDDRVVLVFGRV
ncbi:MAG: protein kinase [Planctomycetia bacterium]|nr:protein kinase [Planctomycetia bacterium]